MSFLFFLFLRVFRQFSVLFELLQVKEFVGFKLIIVEDVQHAYQEDVFIVIELVDVLENRQIPLVRGHDIELPLLYLGISAHVNQNLDLLTV